MAADGVIVVTATGMIGAFLIPTESPINNSNQPSAGNTGNNSSQTTQTPQGPFVLPSVTESLGLTRNFISTVDISYAKSNANFINIMFMLLNFNALFYRWKLYDCCCKW